MKKLFKITSLFLAALMLAACLAACGAGENGDATGEGDNSERQFSVELRDIEWSIQEGVVDSKRYAVLNYKNNSDKLLVGFGIKFKEKSGVSDKDKEEYFSEVKAAYEYNDDKPKDMEKFSDMKQKGISLKAESDRVTKPEKEELGVICYYDYKHGEKVKNAKYCDFVEPDIAAIKYVDNGKVCTIYYDFASKKYSKDGEEKEAFEWATKTFKDIAVKPQAEYVKKAWDDSDSFGLYIYGWSAAQFEEYVEQCKQAGFNIIQREYSGWFEAHSGSGYSVDLTYHDDFVWASYKKLSEEDAAAAAAAAGKIIDAAASAASAANAATGSDMTTQEAMDVAKSATDAIVEMAEAVESIKR